MNSSAWPFLLVLLGISLACNKLEELEGLEINSEAELAFPFINSTISIAELLEETNDLATVYVDETGLIHFLYEGEVFGETARERYESLNFLIPPVVPVTSPDQALPLLIPGDIDIDSLILRTGTMAYRFRNPFQEEVEVEIRLPQIRSGGEALRFEATAPAYSGSGDFPLVTNSDNPKDLSGYAIIPINDTIYVEYTARRTVSGDEVTLDNVALEVDSFNFSYVEGFFGNQVDDSPRDTIEVEFFDSWVQGDVYFADSTITLDFENSFGLPTRAVINRFDVISVRGEVLPLESEFVDDGIDFPFPSLDQVGQVIRTEFVFDKTNSNLDNILGSEPALVDYDINAVSEPVNQRGFFTDSSYYQARLRIDLPLFGTGADYLVRDTVELDLDELDNASEAEFKVVADNGIPLQMEVVYTFINERDEVVATLLEGGELIVEGAPVDAEGNPTGVASKTTFVLVSEAELEAIHTADRGVLTAIFSTSAGDAPVRIADDQQSNVRMGAIVTLDGE
jgi:hypothetical protein